MVDVAAVLVSTIQKKKPLDQIDADIISRLVSTYDLSDLATYSSAQLVRSARFKHIVKTIRHHLNTIYGQFWSSIPSLSGHQSSAERLSFYSTLYPEIFRITGKPTTILDLGCGLNPLSYPFLGCCPTYYAVEYTSFACSVLRHFFSLQNIPGKVIHLDLATLPDLPPCDVCFCFKLFETLETKGHSLAEALLEKIPASFLVVSFATVTVRGHAMRFPRRGWLTRLCSRKGYTLVSILTYPNEIFYIIRK